MKILVLNGPNLNLLSRREPGLYGPLSLAKINQQLKQEGKSLGLTLEFRQSNLEGGLVTLIQRAPKQFHGLLINPGGYSHTSVAIRDAIAGAQIPTVEVHMTNIAAREPFRHATVTAGACLGCISGFGVESYRLGLSALVRQLRRPAPKR